MAGPVVENLALEVMKRFRMLAAPGVLSCRAGRAEPDALPAAGHRSVSVDPSDALSTPAQDLDDPDQDQKLTG